MIRLAKPYIPEEAYKLVIDILKSGDLVQGKYVEQFEQELKKYLGVKKAVIVSSGTAALHLSLLALGIGPGDEVIVPAFGFPATANVIELVGAKSVFVDISLNDYCIDVGKIKEVITKRTKAIIPVHEFGQTADMYPIIAIAKQYDLKIIEDTACALGGEYRGKKAGTFGNMGCFSFHPRKALTTGEGGAIVTNDSSLAENVKSLRNHGISIVNDKIDFKYAGLNYRMTDFQAVLGIAQLKEINSLINQRIKMADIYDKNLKEIKWIKTPKKIAGRKTVYQTYHVMISNDIKRDEIKTNLKNKGIETNIGAYALHMIKYYKKKYNYFPDSSINAKNAYLKGLALPIGAHLNTENIRLICNLIKKI